MYRLVLALAMTGCLPPPKYAIVEVYDVEPVGDGAVAADCGPGHASAGLTDDTGRAEIALRADVKPERCVLTFAKPGYPTIETTAIQLCTTPSACPPTVVQLLPGPPRRPQ